MVLFFIVLLACTAGAISGIGGGVIIKPLMDLLTDLDVGTISMLSSFTVFSMAVTAAVKHVLAKSPVDFRLAALLSAGAICGGPLGNGLLGWAVDLWGSNAVSLAQNVLLFLLLLFVVAYLFNKKTQFAVKSALLTLFIGLLLGTLSAFLSIGGGPINVAALALFFGQGPKQAAVNSILLILFSQSTKLLTAFFGGGMAGLDLSPLWYMIPAAVAGGFLGSAGNHKLSERQVTYAFTGVICFILVVTLTNIIRAI